MFPCRWSVVTRCMTHRLKGHFIKMGVVTQSDSDVEHVISYLKRIGMLVCDSNERFRPNPHSIFDRQETPEDFYRIKTKKA